MATKKAQPWTRQHCSNLPVSTSPYVNEFGVYVYVLWCPLSKLIRYVGCSGHHPKERLLGHVCEARGTTNPNSPKSRWIQGLLAQGLYPTLRYLKGFDYYEEAYILEVQLIDSIGKRRPLLNACKGNVTKAAEYTQHFN